MKKDVSVIILAAGRSSRMGRPKMFLELKSGLSFIENLLDQYTSFGCKEVMVVLNEDNLQLLKESKLKDKHQFKTVLNQCPERERFYSIQCGLKSLTGSEYVFIQNADNPFSDPDLLEHLYNKRIQADYIKPVFKGKGGHPILISGKIIERAIQTDTSKITFRTFLNDFTCEKADYNNDDILTNINDESDYLRSLHET